MANANGISVTEEEQIKQDDARFVELNTKKEEERTLEEKTEFAGLTERYGKRMQNKIDKLHRETKLAQEETKKEREARERLEQEIADLKAKSSAPVLTETDYVEIGGKKYLTDDALVKKIQSNELTEQAAYKYQRERDREEDRLILEKKLKGEDKQEKDRLIKMQAAEKVLEKYPHFKKDHPDFDPDNPLYKKAMEYYEKGYNSNPRGILLAVEDAEDYFKSKNINIDKSDDLNLEDNTPPRKREDRRKEITLTETEKDVAYRMYVVGNVTNPKTKRPYTEQEALATALAAKKARVK